MHGIWANDAAGVHRQIDMMSGRAGVGFTQQETKGGARDQQGESERISISAMQLRMEHSAAKCHPR